MPLLEKLAQLTGGRSFVATDADALGEVFRTIDALEKSPVRGQILTRYDEHYAVYAGLALTLLLVERFLASGKVGAIAMTIDCPRVGAIRRVIEESLERQRL